MKRFAMHGRLAAALCGLFLLSHAAEVQGQDLGTSAEARQDVSLTIYNNDLSLLREVRRVPTRRGTFRLRYEDVTARIDASTVHLQPQGRGSLHLVEQNYEYDLISRDKLMEKFVGREVGYRTQEGTYGRARLLAANQGFVYDLDGKIVFDLPGEVVLDAIPQELIATPTLVWTLEAEREGEQDVEVTYLSGGFSWRADYVLLLDDSESRAGLTGWVTLDNQSGGSFRNAQLQLVAGDVNRVVPMMEKRQVFLADAARAAPQFEEEALFEYHLYTLERRTDVMDRQQKQVLFFDADGVRIEKGYRLRGMTAQLLSPRATPSAQTEPVEVTLAFHNSKDNGLGLPVPQGIVRVYKRDQKGAAQFLGENRVAHTPRDETLRFDVGRAFDVVGQHVQTDLRRVDEHTIELGVQVEIRNHKEQAIQVDVEEMLHGDWEILSSSVAHTKKDARTAVFRLDVPADGKATLTYRARVRS